MSEQQQQKKPVWKKPRPWPTLHDDALYGAIGEIVRLIAKESEADPAAILITILAGLGSIAGPIPRVKIANAPHPARIFAVIVGGSSEGAKGTSYEDALPFLCMVDEEFKTRIRSGFGSGEGIISEFADPKENDADQTKEAKSEKDKRCFLIEEEFSRILTVAAREGSTLSEILRQAWGGGTLSIIRAKDRIIAHGAHISLIGHITPDELKLKLASVDMVNGFANRFLFLCSKRAQTFDFGGDPDLFRQAELARKIAASLANLGERNFHFDDGARAAWSAFCRAQKPGKGLLDALLARARPQCLRLAVAYALADGVPVIRLPHIQAALAVWSYSLASAEHLFGDLCEDKTQAAILDRLQVAYPGGCTSTELDRAFSHNLRGGAMGDALDALQAAGRIRAEIEQTGGRSARRFYAVPPTEETEKTEKGGRETEKGGGKGASSVSSVFSVAPAGENEAPKHPPPPPNPPPFRPGVGAESASNGSTHASHPPEPEAAEEIDY